MNRLALACFTVCVAVVLTGCGQDGPSPTTPAVPAAPSAPTVAPVEEHAAGHPAIASWLAKKDELIAGGKPYGLVMSGWFTPAEASQLRANNPRAVLLAGLSVNFTWDNADWLTFLLTVANYGLETPMALTEDMYLHNPGGDRCAFGWASDSWGHEEIYAMDPANPDWVRLITSFYGNVLEQPQHDGIIIDMVLNKSLFPDAISDRDWVDATKRIMARIDELNASNKMVVLNAGRDLSEIDAYGEYMDGFVMENFMGGQLGSTFEDGLEAADSGYTVIYAVDTDDTGQQDLNRMRLGLVLSLLNDNTWFTYDFGPRDHGQAWWFDEYDVELGKPLGPHYHKDGAWCREFENGMVVASPHTETTIRLDVAHTDVTTGETATVFHIQPEDGRLYVRAG